MHETTLNWGFTCLISWVYIAFSHEWMSLSQISPTKWVSMSHISFVSHQINFSVLEPRHVSTSNYVTDLRNSPFMLDFPLYSISGPFFPWSINLHVPDKLFAHQSIFKNKIFIHLRIINNQFRFTTTNKSLSTNLRKQTRFSDIWTHWWFSLYNLEPNTMFHVL